MPIMDGFEASQTIKKLLTHTVIIALTASVFEDRKEQIFDSGCDDFMSKPFRHTDIFEIIQRYLGVNYICESEDETPDEYELTKESLLCLSNELQGELKLAIETIDIDKIEKLLKQVYSQNAQLADAIKEQIDNFEYEDLLKLFDH
jgi:DNA-binding response OmpR family regulator